MSSASLKSVGPAFTLEAECKSSTELTIRPSPASQWRVSVCVSLPLFTLLGDTECAFPSTGSLWSARAALTLQAVRACCLGSNGLLKGAFQHQVNRNYRPKAWLGPAGQRKRPPRMGRRGMTPQIRLSSGDVCGMFALETIYSS